MKESNINNIPSELKQLPQWVCWRWEERNGKRTKPPINPHDTRSYASSTNPETWATFDEALNEYRKDKGLGGIGFVFTKDDPYAGVDLDDCRDPETEKIDPSKMEIIKKFGSYAEVSPSGKGVKIIVKGSVPKGSKDKDAGIEIYNRERYFCITGQLLDGYTTEIFDREEELKALYQQYFGKPSVAEGAEIKEQLIVTNNFQWNGNIENLPIKQETKRLILEGKAVGERSEALMTVLNALVGAGMNDEDIKGIFDNYPIGEKYREKGGCKENWLQSEIESAKDFIREQRMLGPSHSNNQCTHLVNGSNFQLTDLGNAERLVARHGQDIHYCHVWGKWLVWNGQRWIIDNTAEIHRKAKETVRSIYAEAARMTDGESRKATVKHAMKSESERSIRAMISMAQAEPGVPILPDELDKNHWLLNVKNGTVDLRAGNLMPHTREHLITKIAPVEYDANVDATTWKSFLGRIMDNNENLISFLQRAIGYALTGDTREECLFLLYGTGANGKSTFLETIRALMGDYSQQADFSTFIMKNNETVRNDIARLKGVRFVAASETEAGRRLAEVIVKQLTGNDTVTARFLFREYFEFRPTHKIWLAANNKPIVKGIDDGIWRRIHLIPFEVTIPENERDPQLKNKLLEELPGILKWAINGCLEWERVGLGVPDEVRSATKSYREEMDVLSAFIEECCELGSSHRTAATQIYRAYSEWCNQNGETPMTQRTLGMRLAEKGFKSSRTGSTRYWEGIRLLNETDSFLMTQVTHHDAIFGKYPYESENHTNLPEKASHASLRHRKDEDFDTWH